MKLFAKILRLSQELHRVSVCRDTCQGQDNDRTSKQFLFYLAAAASVNLGDQSSVR